MLTDFHTPLPESSTTTLKRLLLDGSVTFHSQKFSSHKLRSSASVVLSSTCPNHSWTSCSVPNKVSTSLLSRPKRNLPKTCSFSSFEVIRTPYLFIDFNLHRDTIHRQACSIALDQENVCDRFLAQRPDSDNIAASLLLPGGASTIHCYRYNHYRSESQWMEKPEFFHHATTNGGASTTYHTNGDQPANQQYFVQKQSISKRMRSKIRSVWHKMCNRIHKVSNLCIAFEEHAAHVARRLTMIRYPETPVPVMRLLPKEIKKQGPLDIQYLRIRAQFQSKVTSALELIPMVIPQESRGTQLYPVHRERLWLQRSTRSMDQPWKRPSKHTLTTSQIKKHMGKTNSSARCSSSKEVQLT